MVFLSEGNMKKQLYRVKQLADQKFAGAERTEMLNDDLVYKEKQVDALRQVCLSTCKQTRSCIQGQGTDGASIDKRLKKLPDFNLGSTMLECSGSLWEASILGQVLGLCGNLQIELAQHVLTYEVEVEKLVLAKYQEILETDIPNIAKQRKQLTKLTLDYDSAKTRYQQAVRQSTPTPANKIDSIKQEYDEAKQKVETCKDALATELYAVLAKETDLARCLYQLATSQADYHRRALQVLESSIPSIHNAIQVCHDKPVYGGPLGEHLEAADTKIAIPIEKCVCYLLEYGLEEEGILRIAGSSSKVKKLKNSFDVGIVDMHDYDPPVVAGAMKQYLRELPEPLMTFELYDDWMETTKFPDKESRLEAIQRILPKLPKANYDNLRYLIKFLAKVAASQDINKMSSQNLAIVIAINLIWSPDEDQLGMNMGLATTRSAIVDILISHADELFPGEEEFFFSENQKVSYGEYPSISPPLATADDDDDLEVTEVNQLQVRENALDTRRPSDSKNPFSNGSPKEGGSPKVTRKESPKATRKEQKARKKPAPPVPPPPKESNEKVTGDKMKSQVHSEEKPTVPSKPRHVRTASGVSLDLSRPSSSTSVSDAEGGSNSNLVKEHSTSRDGEDSLLSEPILRSNFRASLPLGLRVSDDPELKTASLRSVSQAASALKERSKSTFGPPDGVEVKDTQEGKVVEVTTPGVSNVSKLTVVSNSPTVESPGPPKRPPRPLQRDNKPPPPVAKPRSVFGVQANPEQTHL